MKNLIGLLLIVFGLLFLGNSFDLWNFNLFFDGWWTLFIIIPSICSLLNKDYTAFILGTSVGVLLLLATRDIIDWSMVGGIFIPILLNVIGFNTLCIKKNKSSKTSKLKKESNKDYLAIFGGVENKYTGKGKYTITIDYVCIFGGSDIR